MFQIGISVKNQNRMANNVDPDETAHNELSHQDLHYLQKNVLFMAERVKEKYLVISMGYFF